MKGQQARMEVTQCLLAVYTQGPADSRIWRFRVRALLARDIPRQRSGP
jgi:hypothetical protein